MSISSALSNALSGLTVASRAADVVSSNIANATTEGYGVRSLSVAARVNGNAGQGAWVTGVSRHEDAVLVAARRRAEAELGQAGTRATHLAKLETLIGTPDQAGSIAARTAAFGAALTAAAAGPHDHTRMGAAVAAAVALAGQINAASDGVQADRLQSDRAISGAVEEINAALAELATLNTRIRQGAGGGRDISALLDAQAVLVNRIAPLIPLESRRDATGALQLYSADGQALLDGRPAELGFAPAAVMSPDMTVADGTLSGLTLNGRALVPGDGLSGGRLAALFALRDDWAPEAQAKLDAVARDLAARFEAPGLDPTRPPGAPGLFTDGGMALDPAAETGLAGRLRVNAAVLPEAGGAVWRLRDGLAAVAEGPSGEAAVLLAQVEALTALQPTASGGFSGVARSFDGLVADHVAGIGVARQAAETDQAHIAARHGALATEEAAQGVDTDAEMQRLLRIEQIFAANARVVSAAEEMIDRLIRIGA